MPDEHLELTHIWKDQSGNVVAKLYGGVSLIPEIAKRQARIEELEAKLAGTPLDIVDRYVAEERERIITILLGYSDPDEFRDYIDNDLCGIPCWHEEKLRAALNP